MNRMWRFLALVAVGGMLSTGCGGEDNPLAPYQGERPLLLQQVTVSATPALQWVGGRVAAVGVNRGTQAALDTTLVWLKAADGNDIGSAVTVGANADKDRVRGYGGTPVDQLDDNTEYTFWLAEQGVMEAGLPADQQDGFGFADTTFTLSYILRGRSGGDRGFIESIRIIRDQQPTSDTYTVTWTPGDVGARRLAIREGSSGAFTDLIWDIIAEDANAQGILPPVTIGEPPAGVQVAIPWPDAGFAPVTHTLWMTSENWSGSFSPSAAGYAFFQIFSNNFD